MVNVLYCGCSGQQTATECQGAMDERAEGRAAASRVMDGQMVLAQASNRAHTNVNNHTVIHLVCCQIIFE